MNISITKLTPVFYAENLLPIIKFYRDILGLKVDTIFQDKENPEVIIFDHDKFSLMYCKTGPMPQSSGQIQIDVDDIKTVIQQLPKEINIEWGPEKFEYGRIEFGIRDPNDILIVFSQQC